MANQYTKDCNKEKVKLKQEALTPKCHFHFFLIKKIQEVDISPVNGKFNENVFKA